MKMTWFNDVVCRARVKSRFPLRSFEAGLRVGDKITEINGDPAKAYEFWDLLPMMRQPGDTLHLELLCDNESIRAVVVLRRVI